MVARGEVVLQVSFGPASTPVLPRAVAFAREHADDLTSIGSGAWRATFRLGGEEARYGRALQVLAMAYGWRATTVEVDGSPEHRAVARQMLHCARGWLRSGGRCQERFYGRVPPKCRCCPLYDPEWALESGARPAGTIVTSDWVEVEDPVPDHVPEDWTDPDQ